MKVFCMDAHISVIGDFKTLGLDLEVIDWSLSGHAFVMGRKQDSPNHINAHTWKGLNHKMIEDFQKEYNTFLSGFDAFLVCYSACFAMIYEKYNKPIIWINACRYDLPFCQTGDLKMLADYNACLQRLTARGLLFGVSNNKADQWYALQLAGLQSRYIPSLCSYTDIRYTPTRSTFLCYHGDLPEHPLITPKRSIGAFRWSVLNEFRGVIHFPYEVSTMSMFEHFTGGLPMFFPSKKYLSDRAPTLQSISAYWQSRVPIAVADLQEWIERADFYDVFRSPNTHYFDSIPHLFTLLENFEYVPEGDFRSQHAQRVKTQWRQLIAEIQTFSLRTKEPRHLCYNRLPLLAHVVYDVNYAGSGVAAQHTYPGRDPPSRGDCIFVKTDYLDWFLANRLPSVPITLITGVSDISPSEDVCNKIISHPNIQKWIGCNILASHPKIYKVPIGVGEPGRQNGNHDELVRLHASRIPWEEKIDDICVPFHSDTHGSRVIVSTLNRLPFAEYMTELGKHKFVVCVRGNGLDTHRVCEALLMGSVPIIQHSGLDDMYSEFPSLLVDSFEQIDTSKFTWDSPKYEAFLDIFWMRLENLQAFLAKEQ